MSHLLGGTRQTTNTTSNNTQTVSLPPWMSDQLQANSNTAATMASSPWQGWTGATYAPQTAQQAQAEGITGGIAGYQPQQVSTGYTPQQVSAGTIPGTDLSGYMNPYVQNVIDANNADTDHATAKALQQTAGNAAAQGAFGGDRAAITQAEIAAEAERTKATTSANLWNQNYTQATGLATSDLNRGLAAGTTNANLDVQGAQLNQQGQSINANLGMQGQQLGLAAGQQLFGQGTTDQQAQQQGLAYQQQQYANMVNDPYNKLSWSNGITSGSAPYFTTQTGTGTSTTSGNTGPSQFGQIMGGIGAFVGAAGMASELAHGGIADGAPVNEDGYEEAPAVSWMSEPMRRALGALAKRGYEAGGDVDPDAVPNADPDTVPDDDRDRRWLDAIERASPGAATRYAPPAPVVATPAAAPEAAGLEPEDAAALDISRNRNTAPTLGIGAAPAVSPVSVPAGIGMPTALSSDDEFARRPGTPIYQPALDEIERMYPGRGHTTPNGAHRDGPREAQHALDTAADISLAGMDPRDRKIIFTALTSGKGPFSGINGIGTYNPTADLVHFDLRNSPRAAWGPGDHFAPSAEGPGIAGTPPWWREGATTWRGQDEPGRATIADRAPVAANTNTAEAPMAPPAQPLGITAGAVSATPNADTGVPGWVRGLSRRINDPDRQGAMWLLTTGLAMLGSNARGLGNVGAGITAGNEFLTHARTQAETRREHDLAHTDRREMNAATLAERSEGRRLAAQQQEASRLERAGQHDEGMALRRQMAEEASARNAQELYLRNETLAQASERQRAEAEDRRQRSEQTTRERADAEARREQSDADAFYTNRVAHATRVPIANASINGREIPVGAFDPAEAAALAETARIHPRSRQAREWAGTTLSDEDYASFQGMTPEAARAEINSRDMPPTRRAAILRSYEIRRQNEPRQ